MVWCFIVYVLVCLCCFNSCLVTFMVVTFIDYVCLLQFVIFVVIMLTEDLVFVVIGIWLCSFVFVCWFAACDCYFVY